MEQHIDIPVPHSIIEVRFVAIDYAGGDACERSRSCEKNEEAGQEEPFGVRCWRWRGSLSETRRGVIKHCETLFHGQSSASVEIRCCVEESLAVGHVHANEKTCSARPQVIFIWKHWESMTFRDACFAVRWCVCPPPMGSSRYELPCQQSGVFTLVPRVLPPSCRVTPRRNHNTLDSAEKVRKIWLAICAGLH